MAMSGSLGLDHLNLLLMVRKKVQFLRKCILTASFSCHFCGELVNILISLFAVKGDRDANIMFCPCDGCDGYRVLIGGWANQKSFIRDNENDGNLQTLVNVRL